MIDKKERKTNFDLLKIVAMLMIIILHFNLYGISFRELTLESSGFYFANILEYLCICAVNLYVMITGYFMITSKIKLKKIIKLQVKIIFYCLFLYLILVAMNKTIFDKVQFIKLFFPITTRAYWFMGAYIGLYLLIPYINKIANTMQSTEYKMLLFILTILMVVLKNIFPSNSVFENTGGHSLVWFIYLYLLAGYIRLYIKASIKNWKLIVVIALIVCIRLAMKVFLVQFDEVNLIKQIITAQFDYNSILTLVQSVAIFLFFKNIKIKNKKINTFVKNISPLTLGVYLFHEHPYFRDILWHEILQPSKYIGTSKFYLAFWADILLIFIVGCLIEFIYQFLIKIIKKTKLFGIIEKKIDLKIKKLFEGEQL